MASTQFVPPNGLPLTTPVGTDGTTLADLAGGAEPGKNGASVASMTAHQGAVTPGQNSTATITTKLSDGTEIPEFDLTIPAGAPGKSGSASGELAYGDYFQPVAISLPANLQNALSDKPLPASSSLLGNAGRVITVDPGNTGHEFFGAGAALTQASASLIMSMPAAARTAYLTDVFKTKKWNYVRLCFGTSDYRSVPVYTYCDAGPDADPNLDTFDLGPDKVSIIPICQEILCINPNVVFFGAPWSPPGVMKDSGSIITGMIIPTDKNLSWYAKYFVKTYHAFADYGIKLYAITPQNEPQVSTNNYPCCGWKGSDLTTFIGKYLGPAFVSAGIPMQILAGDTNYIDEYGIRSEILNDPVASIYAKIGDTHGYAGSYKNVVANLAGPFPTLRWMMSEYTCPRGDNAHWHMSNVWEALIACVRYGCDSAVFWNLMLTPDGGPYQETPYSSENGTTTLNADGSVTYQADAYGMSLFMKYWQPGARVCYSTCRSLGIDTQTDIQNVTLVNPDGSRFGIFWNPTANAVTATIVDAVTNTGFPLTLAPDESAAVSWGDSNVVSVPGPLVAPSAPTLSLSGYTAYGYPEINITAPTASGTTEISSYTFYDAADLTKPLGSAAGSQSVFIDTTLTAGSSRNYVAVAVGGGGASATSNSVSATSPGLKPTAAHYVSLPKGTDVALAKTNINRIDNSSGALGGFVQFLPGALPLMAPGTGDLAQIFGDEAGEHAGNSFALYFASQNTVVYGMQDANMGFSDYYIGQVSAAAIGGAGLWIGWQINTSSAAITGWRGDSVPAQTLRAYVSYDGGATVSQLGTDKAVSATSIHTLPSGYEQTISFSDGKGVYGAFLKCAVYSGVNKAVTAVDADFTQQSTGATSFKDTVGNTWTVTAPATVA